MNKRKIRWITAFVLSTLLLLGLSPQRISLPGDSRVITLPGTIQNVEAAALAKPALVSAVAKSPTSVQVTWKKVSKASGYYIYRKLPSDKKWKTVKTITKGTAVTYTDTKLTPGKQYMYTVRAYQTVNGKKNAGSYNTKGIAAVTPPEAVKLLKASGKSGAITITWQKAKGAQGYMVYRKSGTSWSRIKTISSVKTLSYTDKTAKAVPGVSYMVRAYCKYNGKNTLGGYQKAGISVPVPTPTVSLNLKPVFDLKYYIVVRWENVPSATSYEIWKGKGSDPMNLFNTMDQDTFMEKGQYYRIVDVDFTVGQTYQYQIIANTKDGKKLTSQVRTVTCKASEQELTPEQTAALCWLALDRYEYGLFNEGPQVEVDSIGLRDDGELQFCFRSSQGKTYYVSAGSKVGSEETTCLHSTCKSGVSIHGSTLSTKPLSAKIVKELRVSDVRKLKDNYLKEDCYMITGVS
ncbi:MAG: fibronectin type III domain-containing protein [Eubacteriales bacterium]|nr:fibronectin type III domain-containing protein [Eubacteriales bacterium]